MLPSKKPNPISLRLFSPDELNDEPAPTPPATTTSNSEVPPGLALATLRRCFQEHIRPELEESDRAATTIKEYLTMLSWWEKYTDDPPINLIARKTVKDFRTELISKPFKRGKVKKKRSPATVNKLMRTLAACITPLWPADRHNPGGKGLLDFFKFPESLAEDRDLPFVFTRKDMSSLYLACDACRPTGGHRKSHLYDPRLWRAAIVLALNAGPRTWDLFSLRRQDVKLTEFRHGSVKFVACKTRKFQRIPLNRVSRAHLEYVLSLNLPSDRVFPGFAKNKSFYAAWKRICKKANVQAPFESFRKTCSTKHNDIIKDVGDWITGHGLKGVNAKHYDNPTTRVFRAIYSFKHPREFVIGARVLIASPA